ncbi:MAG: hypothetical protein Q4P15_06750 [Propionibacteriaceae bacterium]|nr:hypothetical protein [Propionibacteriaceae bacterium]
MTTVTQPRTRRPWHLWLVAIAMFALYLIGASDYILVLAGDTDYIAGNFGQPGVDYFEGYPVVLRAIWTVNIVVGLLAPLLLVARSRWSAQAAVVATIAQVILLVVTFATRGRWEALGVQASLTDIGVGVVTAALAGYCYWMHRRGVLS